MGSSFQAICEDCGHTFTVNDGGGFVFHLLHCNTCGEAKSIGFEEIGEPHLRYLKGLSGPYCIATREGDRDVQENYPGTPISEQEYHRAVEKLVGKCACGGQFKFKASARCPKCRSIRYKQDPHGEFMCYD